MILLVVGERIGSLGCTVLQAHVLTKTVATA